MIFIVIGLLSLTHKKESQGIFLLALGAVIIAFGAYRSVVKVTTVGLRIRNPFTSFNVGWDEIATLRLGRHGLFPACLLIDLKNGVTRYAFAIQVPNVSANKRRAWERDTVVGLNELLASQTHQSASTSG
jgi:hypothetical protein